MPNRSSLSSSQETKLRAAIAGGESIRSAARSVGISHGKAQRFASKIRKSDEFPKSSQPLSAPRRESAQTEWTIERIRMARDAQLRGDFKMSVRLAEIMRTDDAIFVARNNRIAAHAAVNAEIVARDRTSRAISVAGRAQIAIQTPRSVVSGIQATLVDHAVAIGQVIQETSHDGTMVSMRLEEWPLEHVRENPATETLETYTRGGGERIPIRHGDGRWVIFRRKGIRPWAQDAAILPAALVWAIHTPALQNWAAAARAHGLAKMLGTMPDQTPTYNADGTLTREAQALLTMISDMVSGVAGAGLVPFGAKAEFVSNDSSAWQVFTELAGNREKAAARIYNGTDATLGSQGGAPGVDVAALFGVATTLLQGDFQAIEDGIVSGMIEPWTAINYGDSRLAPRWKYQLPDPDAQKKIDQTAARILKFLEIVRAWKAEGFIADQDTIKVLAHSMGLEIVPQIPTATETTGIQLQIAPTDVAKAVTINEIRASQKLGPSKDPVRGEQTIPEMEAAAKAPAAPVAPSTPAPTS